MTSRGRLRRAAFDGAAAVVLALAALTLSRLEDATNRPRWVVLGLGFAATLLAAGLLQILPHRVALAAAGFVHCMLLALYALLLLACVLMALTILLLGAALVLALPTLLLALHSAAALWRIVAAARSADVAAAQGGR